MYYIPVNFVNNMFLLDSLARINKSFTVYPNTCTIEHFLGIQISCSVTEIPKLLEYFSSSLVYYIAQVFLQQDFYTRLYFNL